MHESCRCLVDRRFCNCIERFISKWDVYFESWETMVNLLIASQVHVVVSILSTYPSVSFISRTAQCCGGLGSPLANRTDGKSMTCTPETFCFLPQTTRYTVPLRYTFSNDTPAPMHFLITTSLTTQWLSVWSPCTNLWVLVGGCKVISTTQNCNDC